jgi:putative transposase
LEKGGGNLNVTRTESHIIKKSHPMFKTIDEYCFKSKNRYNYATYLVRQKFITNGSWLRYSKLDPILQKENVYKECGSQAAQIISLTIDDVWKSYFKSIKDWKKHPEKYLGMPKLPKYKKKDGRFIYSLKNIQYRIDENGFIYFSFKPFKKFNNLFKVNASVDKKLNRINFVPCGSHYVMNILSGEKKDVTEDAIQCVADRMMQEAKESNARFMEYTWGKTCRLILDTQPDKPLTE